MDINLAIAARARAGEALTAGEIDELGAADLLSLGMLADDVRRARVGETVTYVRVFEWDAAGEAGQAGEVRITGLPATLDATVDAIKSAKAVAAGRLLTGFSLAAVIERNWRPLGRVLASVKAAGLDAIAEAPVDGLDDLGAALQACADAGLPVRCLSLQKPAADGRTAMLLRLRDLVSRFPALRTIAPLSREQSVAVPTTGYDDVRAVALARLTLPSVPNIQVDWAQYGPKLAQVALTFGANDVDRVSPVDDDTLGRRRTAVEDVRRNIAAAGFIPVERDPFDSQRGGASPLAPGRLP